MEEAYITNATLPANQDFNVLKAEALAFIQARSGTNWTNYNASDAGITILDQVCFALTELGYCTGFPMADILTNSKGELITTDQFYLPTQIFTTTPVTTEDYRKVIIDGSDAIANVYVEMVPCNLPGISTICRTYLRLSNNVSPDLSVNELLQDIYFQLNAKRNLTVFFDQPRILTPKLIPLFGTIELNSATNFSAVVSQLVESSAEAVFKSCSLLSFKAARESGYSVEDIYEGPRLKNGFLMTDQLGDKQNKYSVQQLIRLIQKVAGVKAISGLCFNSKNDTKEVANSLSDGLITFDWTGSIQRNTLVFSANGKVLSIDDLNLPNHTESGSVKVAAKNESLELPKGSFRDINTYYSVQYTFPDSFPVGNSALDSAAGNLKTVETNQLVGYLALYDQVLANQFAQLANLSTLFSFKNARTPAPSDLDAATAQIDKLNPQRSPYPVPFQTFAPTYFCQSMYNVPNIRYMLKDNYAFNFTPDHLTAKELEMQSWKAYQNDPYNAYMKGLIDLTVEPQLNNLIQRNKMLDHLLARHGEYPAVIDEIIDGSQYTGDPAKDLVIFKSLYLQNLATLSYFQPKAFNFYAAKTISDVLPELTEDEFDKGLEGLDVDFIFATDRTDDAQKIKSVDYTDFAAIELKMNLLFGFNPLYHGFIIENREEENALTLQAQQALWLVQQQKGMLTIETGLLMFGLQAVTQFKDSGNTDSYWQIEEKVTVFEVSQIGSYLKNNGLNYNETTFTIVINEIIYTVNRVDEQWITEPDTYSITDSRYEFNLNYTQNSFPASSAALLTAYNLVFVFPNYIGEMNSPNYKNRMAHFLTDNLPVAATYKTLFLDENALGDLIPAFATWRNSLRYTQTGFPLASECNQTTLALVQILTKYISE